MPAGQSFQVQAQGWELAWVLARESELAWVLAQGLAASA